MAYISVCNLLLVSVRQVALGLNSAKVVTKIVQWQLGLDSHLFTLKQGIFREKLATNIERGGKALEIHRVDMWSQVTKL